MIYIGKSKNIRHRVLSHLGNHTTKKALEMKKRIHSISFELTGSELVALLKESGEIKAQKPIFNRAQKRSAFNWGLYTSKDEFGTSLSGCKKYQKPLMIRSPVITIRKRPEKMLYY